MSNGVCCRPDRVLSQASLCGIYGGRIYTVTIFFLGHFVFSPASIIPLLLHTHFFICHRYFIILATESVVEQHWENRNTCRLCVFVVTGLCFGEYLLWLDCVLVNICCDLTVFLWIFVVTGLCFGEYLLWLDCVLVNICCDWTVFWWIFVVTGLCFGEYLLWLDCVLVNICCDWTVFWWIFVVTWLCFGEYLLWLDCVLVNICCDWTVFWWIFVVTGLCFGEFFRFT
jgi:hypothetical protein